MLVVLFRGICLHFSSLSLSLCFGLSFKVYLSAVDIFTNFSHIAHFLVGNEVLSVHLTPEDRSMHQNENMVVLTQLGAL